jgi:hypothetical protein
MDEREWCYSFVLSQTPREVDRVYDNMKLLLDKTTYAHGALRQCEPAEGCNKRSGGGYADRAGRFIKR